MLVIVRWFRALLGLTVVTGLLVILAASVSIATDEGVLIGALFGIFAAAALILTVGIAAAMVLATDYLQEIRDELRAASNTRASTSSAATAVTSLRSSSGSTCPGQGSASGRTKIKTYKGFLVERDGDGKIWVNDKTFDGLLAAERYIRDQ